MPATSDTTRVTDVHTDVNRYGQIMLSGLWTNNPGAIQLLGLCPLLAISNTVINALGLGLATLFTLLISNVLVSSVRHHIPYNIRIPVFVLLIASIVTAIELVMNAWLHDLYLILGIFIPLIVTNCMIIGRAESFASRQPVISSAIDALAQGGGFLLVLVLLGALRELIGHGTLLLHADLMFGDQAASWAVHLTEDDRGLLIALLPPGAFIGLGLLLALRNLITQHTTGHV